MLLAAPEEYTPKPHHPSDVFTPETMEVCLLHGPAVFPVTSVKLGFPRLAETQGLVFVVNISSGARPSWFLLKTGSLFFEWSTLKREMNGCAQVNVCVSCNILENKNVFIIIVRNSVINHPCRGTHYFRNHGAYDRKMSLQRAMKTWQHCGMTVIWSSKHLQVHSSWRLCGKSCNC